MLYIGIGIIKKTDDIKRNYFSTIQQLKMILITEGITYMIIGLETGTLADNLMLLFSLEIEKWTATAISVITVIT